MTDIVTPAGATIKNAPAGLLQFLVGIQANESGFDYFRAQGSPSGSVQDPSTSVGGGYGAYQFQVGTDQYNEAQAANWDPATQDRIAAAMAEGYLSEFSSLAQQNGVNPWEYVAEAWYGPGTVPQNPIAPSSVPDVANVQAAEEGQANLPTAWVYGPGNTGLTVAQVKKELAGQATPAELTGWTSTLKKAANAVLNPSGTVASATGLSGLANDLNPANWKTLAFTGAAVVFGLGLLGLGVFIFAKDPLEDAARSAGPAVGALAA